MAKNKILILESKDLTAMRFATTLKNVGTASEIVDFAKSVLADEEPLADVDGGNLYIIGTMSLGTHNIGNKFGPKDVADALIVLGLLKCAYLWLLVCNSGLKNPFHQNKVFLDDVHLELRKASLIAKIEGGKAMRIDNFVGYKGYVGFYDHFTAELEGGKEICDYLIKNGGLKYGRQYIHTEPTPASKDNKFLTAEEGVVATKGFDHQSMEIHPSFTTQ